MIKKTKAILIALVLIVVSSGATFAAVAFLDLPFSDKVLVSETEYQNYQNFEKEYSNLLDLKSFLEENYYKPISEGALKIGIYKGLFEGAGDPYTKYMTHEELAKLRDDTAGEFSGIGVSLTPDDAGYISVVSPIEGTPAEKAGIKSGDKIVMVDGVEYNADTLNEAISAMKGKIGTKVTVTVLRSKALIEFNLIRAMISDISSWGEVLDDNIGYIRITSFDANTAEQFEKALNEMESAKVKGLVVDIRSNGGGIVDQSVKIADLLMGEGVIVYTEDRKGTREYFKSDSNRTDLPYVLLVNEASASASEILTAGIKDNKQGTVLGTKTYGKGIIQKAMGLSNGDGIEYTIAQYFSPKGSVIHKKGIEPNVTVDFLPEDIEDGYVKNDRQLNEAIKLLKGE